MWQKADYSASLIHAICIASNCGGRLCGDVGKWRRVRQSRWGAAIANAAANAWLGWQHLAALGLMLFVLRQLARGKSLNSGRGYVPFGPCIAMAAVAMLFYGDIIARAYWQFIIG